MTDFFHYGVIASGITAQLIWLNVPPIHRVADSVNTIGINKQSFLTSCPVTDSKYTVFTVHHSYEDCHRTAQHILGNPRITIQRLSHYTGKPLLKHPSGFHKLLETYNMKLLYIVLCQS